MTTRTTKFYQSLHRQVAYCLLGLLAASAVPVSAVERGEAAPEFTVPSSSGMVSLSEFKGKVVYVDFWASWCGPCKQSFPWMNSLQTKFGARGLQVVGINLDAKREDADRFLAEVPANFRIGFDAKGDFAKRFAIKGMPSSVLIGPDGKVLLVHAGFRDEQRKELEDAITAALATMPAAK